MLKISEAEENPKIRKIQIKLLSYTSEDDKYQNSGNNLCIVGDLVRKELSSITNENDV